MTSLNLISHMCKTRKFVMAILHWKQGSLCDRNELCSLERNVRHLKKIPNKVRRCILLLAYLPFSSPEHKVLEVRYCDRSVVGPSVCLSTIIKKNSSPKLTIRFQSKFTEMILRSCSFKIL